MTTAATHHHSPASTPLRTLCGRLADGIDHTAHDRAVFLAYLEASRAEDHPPAATCTRCAVLLAADDAETLR